MDRVTSGDRYLLLTVFFNGWFLILRNGDFSPFFYAHNAGHPRDYRIRHRYISPDQVHLLSMDTPGTTRCSPVVLPLSTAVPGEASRGKPSQKKPQTRSAASISREISYCFSLRRSSTIPLNPSAPTFCVVISTLFVTLPLTMIRSSEVRMPSLLI